MGVGPVRPHTDGANLGPSKVMWLGAISWSRPHVRRDLKEANQSVVDSKLCASSLRAHGVEHRCADRGEAARKSFPTVSQGVEHPYADWGAEPPCQAGVDLGGLARTMRG